MWPLSLVWPHQLNPSGSPAVVASPHSVALMIEPSGTASLHEAESAFQVAFRTGDVVALEELLHPDVRYVGPDGIPVDRAADLAARRSGVLVLDEVVELDREVQVFGPVGVSRVLLHLVGSVSDQPIDATLIYTRTWQWVEGRWIVVAAHASLGAVGSPAQSA